MNAESALMLRTESGDAGVVSSAWNSSLLVAAGYEPFHLIDMAVTAAAQLSGNAANTATCGSGCLPPDWDLQRSFLQNFACI